MIISQLPELFVQRERALLGPRFDAMFSYPGQGAVRGASVNALRCTPQRRISRWKNRHFAHLRL